MTRRKLVPFLAVPFLAAISGCVAEPPPAGVVYVHHAPPAARAEVIERSPGPDDVWIGGHHAWIAGTYVWELEGGRGVPGAYVDPVRRDRMTVRIAAPAYGAGFCASPAIVPNRTGRTELSVTLPFASFA